LGGKKALGGVHQNALEGKGQKKILRGIPKPKNKKPAPWGGGAAGGKGPRFFRFRPGKKTLVGRESGPKRPGLVFPGGGGDPGFFGDGGGGETPGGCLSHFFPVAFFSGQNFFGGPGRNFRGQIFLKKTNRGPRVSTQLSGGGGAAGVGGGRRGCKKKRRGAWGGRSKIFPRGLLIKRGGAGGGTFWGKKKKKMSGGAVRAGAF